MSASVVFLRSANVGASNRLDSRELATLVAAETGAPVTHYLQSGNLVVGAVADAAVGALAGATESTENTVGHAADTREVAAALSALVDRVIRARWGYELNPVVRTGDELARLSAANPYSDAEPKQVHLLMWQASNSTADAGADNTTGEASSSVRAALLADVQADQWPGDQLSFHGTNAWIRFSGPSHASTLPRALERRLGVRTTARNAATIAALVSRTEG